MTIRLELNPLDKEPNYIGTITHARDGVAVGIHHNYMSKWPIRRYLCGLEPANYPVPAIRQGWDYGRSLVDGGIVLYHWYQDRF